MQDLNLIQPFDDDRLGRVYPFLSEGDVILPAPDRRAAQVLPGLLEDLAERWPDIYATEAVRQLPPLGEILTSIAGPRRCLRLTHSHVLTVNERRMQEPTPMLLKRLLGGHQEHIRQSFVTGALLQSFEGTTKEEIFGLEPAEARKRSRDDRFRTFLKRVGLRDLCSPGRIAERVISSLRYQYGDRYPDEFYARLMNFLRYNPGCDIAQGEFEEIWSRVQDHSDLSAEEAFGEINSTIAVIYAPVQAQIDDADRRFIVPLTLELNGLEAFCPDRPFGLGTPGHGSLFRIARVEDGKALPPFLCYYLCLQHEEQTIILPLGPGEYFPHLEVGQQWCMREHHIPVTREQLVVVGSLPAPVEGEEGEQRPRARLLAASEPDEDDTKHSAPPGTRPVMTLEELRRQLEGRG
jgi:hypothetical protein